jgi:thiosulfate reductase cytochrome b subunit
LRDIVPLQKIAFIGVLSVTYNVLTIVVLLFAGFIHKGQPSIIYDSIFECDWSKVRWAVYEKNAFAKHTEALASMLFCFINHQLVFPTCKNIENRSKLNAVFYTSVMGTLLLYVATGLSGYLLLLPHDEQLPISAMVLTNINTPSMTLGKLLIVVSLYIALPLSLHPARTILSESLGL